MGTKLVLPRIFASLDATALRYLLAFVLLLMRKMTLSGNPTGPATIQVTSTEITREGIPLEDVGGLGKVITDCTHSGHPMAELQKKLQRKSSGDIETVYTFEIKNPPGLGELAQVIQECLSGTPQGMPGGANSDHRRLRFNPETGHGSYGNEPFRFSPGSASYNLFLAACQAEGKRLSTDDVLQHINRQDIGKGGRSTEISKVVTDIRKQIGLSTNDLVQNNGVALTIPCEMETR